MNPSTVPTSDIAAAGAGAAGTATPAAIAAASSSANTASSSRTSNALVVGGYKVGEEIGRGSFATVYIGRRVSSSSSASSTTTSTLTSGPGPLTSNLFSTSSSNANPSSPPNSGIATSHPMYVAIKTVNKDKLNRKLAENLESEIKILKEISHENVVGLLDIVKTDKHIHLIMEFCSMGDLSAYIKKKGQVAVYAAGPDPTSPPSGSSSASNPVKDLTVNPIAGAWGGLNEFVVRHFLRQLASAVEFLRGQSLIHRDIKPQNLLLNPAPSTAPQVSIPSPFRNGQPTMVPALPILKLADFGFARALPQQSLASTLCGSPLYMAPEILRGDRYDAKADLWSVGAVLYEALTGRPPFKAQNHIELLRRIDKGEGHIRFPGEEDNDGRKSVLATRTSANQLGTSPSPSSRAGPPAFVVGSLGASPRFPTAMTNALNIADDLKDLVRRLLKRNPIERMSFEEFFLHPAVLSDQRSLPLDSWIVDSPKLENTTSQSNTPSSALTAAAALDEIIMGLNKQSTPHRASIDSTRLLQETAAINSIKSRRQSLATAGVPATSPTNTNAGATDTSRQSSGTASSTSISSSDINSQPSQQLYVTARDQQMYFRGDLRPDGQQGLLHRDASGKITTGGVDLAGLPPLAQIEAPFPEYNVDPAKLFVDPPNQAHQQHAIPPSSVLGSESGKDGSNSRTDDKDALSSISSLGSIELSDDGSPPNSTKGNEQLQSGRPIAQKSNSAQQQQQQYPTSPTRNAQLLELPSPSSAQRQPIPANKSSFDEYVVVERKVVEVNWLADEVAASASVIAGQAVGNPSREGGAFYPPPATPSPPTHSPSTALQSMRTAPIPMMSARAGSGVGSQLGASPNYRGPTTPPSPRNSITGRVVAAFGAVAGFVGGSAGSGSHNNALPTGGGRTMMPGTSVGSTHSGGYSRSMEGPRVLGSLRESTHNFLELNSPSPHLTAPPTPQNTTSGTFAGGTGAKPPLQIGVHVMVAAENDDAQLLTSLNLFSLRAHAVNVLADDRMAEVVRNSNANPQAKGVAIESEEVLNLYLGALGLYQMGMEAAKIVWDRDRGKGNVDVVSLSSAVQWIRERFNACLDKAGELRDLVDAGGDDAESAGSSVHARSLEKLLYEKALDISRGAALSEATAMYQSAEAGYTQAALLLEAALCAGSGGLSGFSSLLGSEALTLGAMPDGDKVVIEKFIASIGKRLEKIKDGGAQRGG